MHLSEIWHSKKNDCRLSRTQVIIKLTSCENVFAFHKGQDGLFFQWISGGQPSILGITEFQYVVGRQFPFYIYHRTLTAVHIAEEDVSVVTARQRFHHVISTHKFTTVDYLAHLLGILPVGIEIWLHCMV